MINFDDLKAAYALNALSVLQKLLPGGRVEGNDYVVKNPCRNDSEAGSFRINIATGRYNDFATGNSGGDIIDLIAFIYNCDTLTAARKLEEELSFHSLLAGNVPNERPAKKEGVDPVCIWNKSIKADHAYLQRKQISIGNARVNVYRGRKQLVVPLTDSIPNDEDSLQIKGLQFIQEDGRKYFPLPFKGLFHIASDYKCPKDVVVIAEGYATARSIRRATGLFAIAAMSACNMKAVALKVRELLQYSEIVIAADNDEAGLKAADEALQALGHNVEITYPTECNDYNDLLLLPHGLSKILNYFKHLTKGANV